MTSNQQMTLTECRDILTDEIRQLRGGTTTAKEVSAISVAMGKWLNSIKLDLVYSQMKGEIPDLSDIITTQPLLKKITSDDDEDDKDES